MKIAVKISLIASLLLLAACSSGLAPEAPTLESLSTSRTLKLSLATGADDTEETVSGAMRTGTSTRSLDFSAEGGSAQSVGLRFTGVSLPKGAKVTRAYIDFKAAAADSSRLVLTVRGVGADNTPVFTTASKNLSQRPTTVASALWHPRAWAVGQATRTADLAAIVQEIVSRPDWVSGNALAFVITGDGKAKRSAVSRDASATDGPILYLTYEAAAAAVTTPAPAPAPTPAPTPPTPAPTPTPAPSPTPSGKGPRGSYTSLRADSGFSRNELSADVRVWYDRLMSTIENPKYHTHPATSGSDPSKWASSGDLFHIGRSLNTHITTLMTVFRITRDPQILNEMDRLMQLVRADLKDYNGDGFLNLRYLNATADASSLGFYGDDFHEMDEILTHSMIAAAAQAFRQNASDARYAERAEFWTDYLRNDFEAKWRKRKGKPSGFPFMTKELTHAYAQWIRYHYYMGELTGEGAYTSEARRMASNIANHMVEVSSPAGAAFVWDHRISDVKRYSNMGCQMFVYVRHTMQAFQDLALEEFSVFANDGFMSRVSNGFTSFVMDDGIRSYGPTICGSSDKGGLQAKATSRGTQSHFAGWPYYVTGPWDSTGKIMDTTIKTYAATETYHLSAPRKGVLPAAMVFMLATR